MAKTRTKRKSEPESSPGLMTYSVRFTESERALLASASALKSWTPTNLVRQAALEWAAAIVNNSAQPSFKRLALILAEQAARPRFYVIRATDFEDADADAGVLPRAFKFRVSEDELANLQANAYCANRAVNIEGVEPETPQLPADVTAEINKASKYGGVEFLRSFIAYNEGLAAPEKVDVTKIVAKPDSE